MPDLWRYFSGSRSLKRTASARTLINLFEITFNCLHVLRICCRDTHRFILAMPLVEDVAARGSSARGHVQSGLSGGANGCRRLERGWTLVEKSQIIVAAVGRSGDRRAGLCAGCGRSHCRCSDCAAEGQLWSALAA